MTTYRHRVRYLEVDQQGVVFNMWYLGYFDEAMADFLADGGLPYAELLESGHDVQLVHTEIDWRSSLRWAEEARVEVALVAEGTTSFSLSFEVYGDEAAEAVAVGQTVYVVVATDGSGKRPIPGALNKALRKAVGDPG